MHTKESKGIEGIGVILTIIMLASIFAAMPLVPVVSAASIQLYKETYPDPGASYSRGDVITYKMVVTCPDDAAANFTADIYDTYPNGTVELLEDDLLLEIDENKTYYRDYTVTAADETAGSVKNTLNLTGTDGSGQAVSASVDETSTIVASEPPVFSFTFEGIGCLEVEFNGSASDDGSIANHTWSFGDTESEGPTPGAPTNTTHTYTTCGVKTVTLSGYDDEGNYNSTTDVIYVDCGPTAVARAYPSCFEGEGEMVTFSGSLSHPDTGNTYDPQTIDNYSWTFSDNGTGSSDNSSVTSRMVNDTVTATLTVTDSLGCEDTAQVTVGPCNEEVPAIGVWGVLMLTLFLVIVGVYYSRRGKARNR